MDFIDQSEKGSNSVGAYVLTILAIITSYFFGGIVMLMLAEDLQGVNLVNPSETTDLNSLLVLMLIPFIFVFLTILLCIRYVHFRPVQSIFTSRDKFDWKRFFLSFFIWGGIMVISLIISIIMGMPIEWNFRPDTFVLLLLISVFLIPVQTTAEELLFRGYMLQGFKRAFSSGIASIAVSGTLFGLMHIFNPEIAQIGYGVLVYYILTGVFLGLLTHMDDGMELGMGYHAINNIFGVLILTNDWQALHSDALFIDHSRPSFGLDAIVTLILIQPALLYLYSKVYKWGSWKEKLFKSKNPV